MVDHSVHRRTVLKRAGLAGAGVALTGGTAAAGRGAKPRIVGTSSRAATREARGRADAVRRVIDFGDIGTAVAGRFSDRAAAELGRRSDVRYVERDATAYAIETVQSSGECLPWGVDRTDADVAHANGETGAGADVAIIDTGIDPDHPDLGDNVGAGRAFVDCRGGPNDCETNWADDNGHGTHCAGIADALRNNSEGVVGVSTEATLHAVKVLDKNGRGSYSDIADGIRYTADQGWHVGSLSLGGSSDSQTLRDACQYAYDNGVLLVAAAGNDGPCTDCVSYPAKYSTVVAVSATSKDDSLANFSSTGPEIELAAPGENVYSTYDDGTYDTLSGTSMACPHVSGAGGQLMANGYSNSGARDQLNATAEDLGLGDTEQGNGLLDVAAALGYDSSDDGTGSC